METPKIARTALIDGDIIAFQSAAAAQSHQLDELELKERIESMVEDWTERAFCSDAIICISGPREANFRKEVYPLYKANRPDERPEFLPMAMSILRESKHTIFEREFLEADDGMGLLATVRGPDGELKVLNPVIVSPDKDMRTVPGWHFNPRIEDKRGEDFPVRVTKLSADKAFIMQWMTGDTTDGYKGIDRFGEKGAEKLMNDTDPADWEYVALEKYRSHKKEYSYEYAIQMARCARILTAEWWDSKTKAPILWTPEPIIQDDERLSDWMGIDPDESE